MSLTGGSKLIAYMLFVIPILFALVIGFVSPNYFEPFYTTGIGMILMLIMFIIYTIYIIIVNKIMKVRM